MPQRVPRAFILLILLLLVGVAPARAGVSDAEAIDIMERVSSTSAPITSFESTLEMIRSSDAAFMDLFFAPSQFYGPKFNIPGIVNKRMDGGFSLFLRDEGTDYHQFAVSGVTLRYLGRVAMIGNSKVGQSAPKRLEEQVSETVQQASGQAPATPIDQDAWWRKMAPSNGEGTEFHPLVFLWPYELLNHNVQTWYRKLPGKEPVFGMDCDVLEGHLPDGRVFKIWVAREVGQVARISVPDPSGGEPLVASYTRFGEADPEFGYRPYSRVEVTQGMHTLYQASLTDPRFNVKDVKAVQVAQTPEPPRRGIIDSLPEGPLEQVWTAGLIFTLVLLGLGLAFLSYRFVRFRLSRQRFSEELVVLDEPDGNFAEVLEGLGFPTMPFGPEVLSLERHRLGQKVTAEATERPRAVVVAPDSIAEGKGYFFLLKAYVEEGGRVLVMPHSPKTAVNLPFKVEFLRLPPGEAGTTYVPGREDFLPEVRDVGHSAAMVADRDCVLRVNGKAPDSVLLAAVNTSKAVQAAAVGVVRQGKGEWILCQLHLDKGGGRGVAGQILVDLVAWVQARPSRKEQVPVA